MVLVDHFITHVETLLEVIFVGLYNNVQQQLDFTRYEVQCGLSYP